MIVLTGSPSLGGSSASLRRPIVCKLVLAPSIGTCYNVRSDGTAVIKKNTWTLSFPPTLNT